MSDIPEHDADSGWKGSVAFTEGPDGFADRSHELDRLPPLGRRKRHPGAAEWIELERGIATCNGVERFLCNRDRVAVGLVPAVRIRSHAVAVFPA